MPKASIIIPIYNVQRYLKKTVESVLNQSETDIEIILVDDGSTDSSGSLCDAYGEKDSRVKVIHKQNGGLSSARNAGTAAATSNYIMYLDGDDYLKENAVERAYGVIEQYPSDFVQFMYQELEEGQLPTVQTDFPPIYQAQSSKELFENLYKLGGVAASGATKLFRRELMLRIPFEDIRHEDEMWCTRAFRENLTVTYIPDELYYYVMRQGSIIHSGFNPRKLDAFLVSEERRKVLQELGLQELLGVEYAKLFRMILSMYHDAKNARDAKSVDFIRHQFLTHRKEIEWNNALSGRFRWIFKLMCVHFNFIEIYRCYWNLKGKGNG